MFSIYLAIFKIPFQLFKVVEAHDQNQLIQVEVKFQSSKPISTTAKLTFVDDHDNE